MIKHLIKFSVLATITAFTFLMTSCEEDSLVDTNETEVENFVEDAVYNFHERANCGKFGCYEFVFPITISFEDETTAEVSDYENMKETIKAWREANPDATDRPSLVYPIEVTSEDGEIISVASVEELFELRRECFRDGYAKRGHRWHRHRGTKCFTINFPLSIEYPDGTTEEVADRMALKMAARAWKEANPDAEDRPSFVFPIDVTLDDETVVSVASVDDLKALKDSCSTEN